MSRPLCTDEQGGHWQCPLSWLGPAESHTLVRDGPWRVQALVYHFLCPTEGEDVPGDALSVEVVIVPAQAHERVLVADVTVQHAGPPGALPAIPRLL